MKIAICDDDSTFMRILADTLGGIFESRGHDIEVSCFKKPEDLIDAVRARPRLFDIYFLDIVMPLVPGTTLSRELRRLEPGCKIVFITAYDDTEVYAAFHYRADAFVPKRLLDEHLPAEVDFILERIRVDQSNGPLYFEAHVPRPENPRGVDMTLRLRPEDILYFERGRRQVQLHADGATYALRTMDFKTVLEEYHQNDFVQTHRCFLVNLAHIRAVGKQDVLLRNDERVLLSRRWLDEVMVRFIGYMEGRDG